MKFTFDRSMVSEFTQPKHTRSELLSLFVQIYSDTTVFNEEATSYVLQLLESDNFIPNEKTLTTIHERLSIKNSPIVDEHGFRDKVVLLNNAKVKNMEDFLSMPKVPYEINGKKVHQRFIDELPWALEDDLPHIQAAKVFAWIFFLQPFENGNKRTAHLFTNALLISGNHCYFDFDTNDVFDELVFEETKLFYQNCKTGIPDCSLLIQKIASKVK